MAEHSAIYPNMEIQYSIGPPGSAHPREHRTIGPRTIGPPYHRTPGVDATSGLCGGPIDGVVSGSCRDRNRIYLKVWDRAEAEAAHKRCPRELSDRQTAE